ncbi:MAG: hypothetical protein Q8P68_02890 [Candidatus Peregrinibacteria bacterium]|nr:hypothetical protein [Candidatus Peregrinibacteria bacterium]MDZ4245257.1 hypothetical protein [Candidatus Gracilibacteria bacterium]
MGDDFDDNLDGEAFEECHDVARVRPRDSFDDMEDVAEHSAQVLVELDHLNQSNLELYQYAIDNGLITEEEIIFNVAEALGIRLSYEDKGWFFQGVADAFSDKGTDIGAVAAELYVNPGATIGFIWQRWKQVLSNPSFLWGQGKQTIKQWWQAFTYENGGNAGHQIGYSFGMVLTFLPTMILGGGVFSSSGWVAKAGVASGAGVVFTGATAPSISAMATPELRTPERMQDEVAQSLDYFFYSHSQVPAGVEMKVRLMMGIIAQDIAGLSLEDRERLFSLYTKIILIKNVVEGGKDLIEEKDLTETLDIAISGAGLVKDPLNQDDITFLLTISIDAIYALKRVGDGTELIFDDEDIFRILDVFSIPVWLLRGDFLDGKYFEQVAERLEDVKGRIPDFRAVGDAMHATELIERVYDVETDTIDTTRFNELFSEQMADKISALVGTSIDEDKVLDEGERAASHKIADKIHDLVVTYSYAEFDRLRFDDGQKIPKDDFIDRLMDFEVPHIEIAGYDSIFVFVKKYMFTSPDEYVEELDEIEVTGSGVLYREFLGGADTALIERARELRYIGDGVDEMLSAFASSFNPEMLGASAGIVTLKNRVKDGGNLSKDDAKVLLVDEDFLTDGEFKKFDFVPVGLEYTPTLIVLLYLLVIESRHEELSNKYRAELDEAHIELVVTGMTPDEVREARAELRLMKEERERIAKERRGRFFRLFAFLQNQKLPPKSLLYEFAEGSHTAAQHELWRIKRLKRIEEIVKEI